jgi:hypothetical protein
MENSHCDRDLQEGNKRKSRQLQTCFIDKCAMQNPGINNQRQPDVTPTGSQPDKRKPTWIHARKSCASKLMEFMDRVTKSVDEGIAVDIFYLDFAKACD